MINVWMLALEIKKHAEELHEIGDALFSTNAMRGRRINQIARNLDSLVDILNTPEAVPAAPPKEKTDAR